MVSPRKCACTPLRAIAPHVFKPRFDGAFFLPLMNPDLERLIRLQQIETGVEEARRKIAEHPQRIQAIERRLAAAREVLAAARQRLTDCQNKRRVEEKDLAITQARLAKYKDQLLEVKTNREYQAMLHEIEAAQSDVRTHEDRILEMMIEADELTAAVKQGEVELKEADQDAALQQEAIARERTALEAELERTADVSASLAAEISPEALAIFEQIARSRKGIAVAEARNGLCTICHVRLRPQVFNEVRRNAAIIQCDSCRRILYYPAVEHPAASDA